MKKKIYLLAGTLFVLSLCSCSIQTFTDGNHQESSSATTSSSSSEGNSSEVPSTPEISNRSDISISDSTADSPSATPDVISSSTSSSDSNESPSDTQVSPDTYTLTRYDSIYDVPYAKLDYKSYVEEDGDSGHLVEFVAVFVQTIILVGQQDAALELGLIDAAVVNRDFGRCAGV